MTQALAPCPTCSRHVTTTERLCPFCKAALPEGRTAIPGATHRLTRAAAFAFTASLALATSCGNEADDTVGPVGGDSGTRDGATSGDSSTQSQTDTGSGTDGSSKSDGNASDDGSAGDAGADVDDDGNVQPPYGAPAYGGPFVDAGKG